MTTSINDIPPWEGPDLLAAVREAARKAGEAAESIRSSAHAKQPALRKERTWADVEASSTLPEPKTADSIQTPVRELPAWLQKAREENARISARVREERANAGTGAPARTRRAPTFPSNGAGRKGAPLGNRNGAVLTEAQVVEIWHSTETGAALSKLYGVSAMNISNIRSGKRWGSLTATLGEPGVALSKAKGRCI